MAVRQYGTRSIRWRLGGAQWGPFEGGLNLRDSYNEVAPSELTDGTNFTLDERGVASKRNDCPTTAALAGASTPPGAVTAFFFSISLNLFICQVGTTLYKAAPGAGSWTSFNTVSTSAVCAFVDFNKELVYTHLADGVFSYDGTTNTLRNAGIHGSCIAAWQNKVFVSGALDTPDRIFWCAIGDSHTWAGTLDSNSMREKDGKTVTALFGGSGLLAFKEDSTYRINDSTTGAYQTIDWNTGCVGPLAVCGSDEGIYVWGLDGLYRGSGLGSFVLVGDKLRPRFISANVNSTTKPLISAAYLNGRVYFAFPRTSATIPDAILEYNPRVGWTMEAYLNARVGPFVHYPSSTGIPSVSFASASATIKDLYTSTTRTGFSGTLTTGYVEPFGGRLGRLTRLTPQVFGTAGTAMTITVNYIAISGAPVAWTGSFTVASATGAQRPVLQPKIEGSAFQVSVTDPNNIASFSLEAVDADFVLSSLR
jgi:hypothetical protein